MSYRNEIPYSFCRNTVAIEVSHDEILETTTLALHCSVCRTGLVYTISQQRSQTHFRRRLERHWRRLKQQPHQKGNLSRRRWLTTDSGDLLTD